MGWDEGPCQADQRTETIHQIVYCSPQTSRCHHDRQWHSVQQSGLCWLCLLIRLHLRDQLTQTPPSQWQSRKSSTNHKTAAEEEQGSLLCPPHVQGYPTSEWPFPKQTHGKEAQNLSCHFSQVPETHNTWSWCHQSKRGGQQRKTASQLQPATCLKRTSSTPARRSSLDQGHERSGDVVGASSSPRSYIIKTQKGTITVSDATKQPSSPLQQWSPMPSQQQQWHHSSHQDCRHHPLLCSNVLSPSHQQPL